MKKTSYSLSTICGPECPVWKAANIIDGKWTTLIIRDLLSGKKRYSEILRSLDKVSPKMLASRLKFLKKQRIISKKIYPTIPPKTEYQLTKLGQELEKVIIAMDEFGKKLK